MVGPVLLQAALLARIAARAMDGATLAALWSLVVLLALAFALRGVLVWGMEVAGRRAAASVLSELRLALVDRRLRTPAPAADRAQAGGIAGGAGPGGGGARAVFPP